ncbi:MBL fold metallo-hydrolase [Fulvimarina sp. 2208YS6-2-32]|uniref:MBL fold metallo-hydrolase n=1 Tax=Fulvimarina uroteuthidis TaxID=3098149 RepID=A0ABU5I1W5_9HYPH|nr:MBL fold metallo-hydrolase [Fulvimarina sp. 2208YS6-2-32]MDY8109364.1 MBL fold metallo-hydrolase [Fulvimarina sp. 2208YS6-2-32]
MHDTLRTTLRIAIVLAGGAASLLVLPPAFAQDAAPSASEMDEPPSQCRAIASLMPNATFAQADGESRGLFQDRSRDRETTITYVTHSTFVIESPDGVTVATDYAGYSGEFLPDIVTMNKAHGSHYTLNPDPAIASVLPGWNPEGGPARHRVVDGDVYVRNVPTDIRSYGGMEPDGNSIFIVETGGLCIGHLGHLHHMLTEDDYAAIGRLDILMVPVDGGMTMSQSSMGEIADRLRSSIVLPMHRFRGPIERFLDRMPGFAVERPASRAITVSPATLPRQPTVIVLEGV